jgi:hypothetical protein
MTIGDSEHLAGRYRVLFDVRQYSQRASVEGRVLRRLWYSLRRENLVTPAATSAEWLLDSTMSALRSIEGGHDLKAEAIVGCGEVLLYDDGERIVLPDRMAGRVGLLLDGTLAEPPGGRRSSGSSYGLSRESSLRRIQDLLSERIGPYAGYAVEQAAADGASLVAICQTTAEEIDDLPDRAQFLKVASPPAERIHKAGLIFRARQNSGFRDVSEPPLWAVGHTVILAVPEQALTSSPAAPLRRQ